MAPFEALYGRRCRTPLNWSQVGERKFFGPNLVKEAKERVEVIKENLKPRKEKIRCGFLILKKGRQGENQ
jgi:hypothetical protein